MAGSVTFPGLPPVLSLAELISLLELKGDRVAVEKNGEIVPRTQWSTAVLTDSDRLEMVHFVGGGSSPHPNSDRYASA